MTRAKVHSRISENTAELTFLVMDKVSQSVPSEDIDDDELDLSRNIPLADPEFHRSAGVDGLIGPQLFWNILRGGRVNFADKHMQLRNAEIG